MSRQASRGAGKAGLKITFFPNSIHESKEPPKGTEQLTQLNSTQQPNELDSRPFKTTSYQIANNKLHTKH